jgi:hypothetical protein
MIDSAIYKEQKKILFFVKNYVKALEGRFNVANSAVCYFHNYGNYVSSSFLKLKFYKQNYYLNFFLNLFKNIYSTIQTENYICIKNIKDKKYKYFLISHVSKKDFLRNGSYFDKYFGLHSKDYQNTLFFLNSVDGYSPKKLQNNIIIFKKDKKNLSIIFLLKKLIEFLIKNKASPKKIFHQFNFLSQFSHKILPHLIDTIKENNFKKIIMFYEAQPYQNNFIHELKKRKIEIETIGFYHSGLLPLHTSLVFREGAPDKLLISGKFQKIYCEKYLGWPKNRVKNVESFRYSKKSLKMQKDKIFLPYEISRSNIILKSLEKIFNNANMRSLPLFSIQNHPATLHSKKHLKIISRIQSLMLKYKEKFNRKSKKFPIFIGSTTSVILALEQKKQIIHICEDPIFDSFNSGIWKDLIVTKVDKFIFKYRLKQNKHILNIHKNNKNKIKKYLK